MNDAKPKSKVKLDRKHCAVCGEPSAGHTGYVFYQSGRILIGAPYCQRHLETFARFASPVFENQKAVELFATRYPKDFERGVKGKPLIFFTRIGYHSLTVS